MLRVGLAGFGYWGPNLARALNSLEGAQFAAIAENSPAKLSDAKEIYGNISTFQSVEDLIESSSIDALATLLNVNANQILKAIVVRGTSEDENADEDTAGEPVVLFIRGDHELNEIKAEKLPGVLSPLQFASDAEIQTIGGVTGFVGPRNLSARCYVDRSAAHLADFICGANEKDAHLTGVNWDRDAELPTVADLRNVVAGDDTDFNASPAVSEGKLYLRSNQAVYCVGSEDAR